jgi:hypothetical protein
MKFNMQTLKSLEIDELFFECSFCMKELNRPMTLPCEHTVCERCYGKFLRQSLSNIYPLFYCFKCGKEFNLNEIYLNTVLKRLLDKFKQNGISLETMKAPKKASSNEKMNNLNETTLNVPGLISESIVSFQQDNCVDTYQYRPVDIIAKNVDDENEEETVAYIVEIESNSTSPWLSFIGAINYLCPCLLRSNEMNQFKEPFKKSDLRKIFISHHFQSINQAFEIEKQIEAENSEIWFECDRIYNQINISKLACAIENCDLFICIVSKEYSKSLCCKNEILFAYLLNKEMKFFYDKNRNASFDG